MVRRRSLLSLLCLLVVELPSLINSSSSDTVIAGRCHQKCATEFMKMTVRIRNDRSVANEPLTNSTEALLCRLGCLRIPGFNEKHSSSHTAGRRMRTEIDDTTTESVGRSVPIVLNSVDFLCTRSAPNRSRLDGSIELGVEAENTRIIAYHLQVFSRRAEGDKELLIDESHVFSTLVDFSIEMTTDVHEVQVRASAYDAMGLIGDTVASRWWQVDTIRDSSDVPLKMSLQRQMWHEERAAALLSIDWPSTRIPSCDLRLKIVHHDTGSSQEEITVQLDETRTVMAHRLHYEETYAIEVERPGVTSSSMTGPVTTGPAVLVITVDACLQMAADPNMCPPPPVSALSYKWNTTDTFVVSWRFEHPLERGGKRSSSHHFLVSVSLQPKRKRVQTTREINEDGRDEREREREEDEGVSMCDEKIHHIRKTYTAEIRSATFRLPPSSLQCAFAVEVTAIDARNRRSRGVIIDSRQAEMESWQQVESAGIEVTLLWAVFIVMCVTGVAVSLMVLRHQQRSSMKKNELKEREQHREILDSLYGRDTIGRYAPAPSAIHTFLTAPSPSLAEVPRGVYRVGRGWSGGDNSHISCKDVSYASRLISDDGYAICELHDETVDCQHNLSLFPLPHTDRYLCGVPVYSPSDYDMVELVGRGRFGDVFTARFIHSTTLTAVKHFNDSSDLQCEFTAARSLSLSRSPFFPSLVGVVCPHDSLALTALVYEYCPGGDLRSFLLAVRDSLPHRSHLARSLRIVVPRIFCFLRSTAASLAELHSRSVVHRDLSTRNVLLTARWKDPFELNEGCEAKLGDLGLCCSIDGEEGSRRLALPWQSPQVRMGGRYSIEDDIWSFGCLLLEVATLGGEPWSGGDLPTIDNGRDIGRHVETIGVGHAKIDASLSNRLRPLMSECLSLDRSSRPSIRRVIDHLISLNTSTGTLQTSDLLYYTKDSQFV